MPRYVFSRPSIGGPRRLCGGGWQALLLVVVLVLTSKVHFVRGNEIIKSDRIRDEDSIAGKLKLFAGLDLGLGPRRVDPPEKQPIMVIGAGQGRTGTASMVEALRVLGLESYHMKRILDSTAHTDLWYQYYVEKSITFDHLVDGITKDGFNATMDIPISLYFEPLMKRFPKAKVILTLRKGGAESWVQSLYESVYQFNPLLQRIPFRWMPQSHKRSKFFEAVHRVMGTPVDPATHLPAREDMVAMYDRWTQHVLATVPKDKLLVFYAHEGWKPLCDFLSPLSSEVERNCQRVLELGVPYPHTNDRASIQKIANTMRRVCSFFETAPILVALYVLIRFIRSRHESKTKGD